MKNIKSPLYVRTSNISLSRFQSVITQHIKDKYKTQNPKFSNSKIEKLTFDDPMNIGLKLFVAHSNGKDVNLTDKNITQFLPTEKESNELHPMVHAYAAKKIYKVCSSDNASVDFKDKIKKDLHLEGFPYSDYAYLEWLKAAGIFLLQGDPYPSPYTDASKHASTYTIPSNSKIIILGDFGTGLDDATDMLYSICKNLNPDFIIHLGDIYYSGTVKECKTYFSTFEKVFKAVGKKIPVFSLPGNHEYISGGHGYFTILPEMNTENIKYNQNASFFCLRTEDEKYQFLGMDTGYNSVHTSTKNLIKAYGPWLDFDEAAWHVDKLKSWKGNTILLSHHQLFSVNETINDSDYGTYQSASNKKRLQYLNGNLFNVFSPYFDKIAAWFWGHEHNFMIFEDGQEGLSKGRLIGNSGYEQPKNEKTNTDSPYKKLDIELATSNIKYSNKFYTGDYSFLNHGFAFIDLNKNVISYGQSPITSIQNNGSIEEPKLNFLHSEMITPNP